MRHQIKQTFYANAQDKGRALVSVEAVCGQIAQVQWRPGMRIAGPGEPMNTTNQAEGPCPRCYPETVRDPMGAPEQAGVGGASFLRPSGGAEQGQNGDVLGGYSVEGEDQITPDGRAGRVGVISGMPVKQTEVRHGQDRLGGYTRADGLGQPVEVNDPDQIKRLAAEERRRQMP